MKRVSLPTKIVALVLSANLSNVNAQSSGELHVPSPDWREQIIYFVMVDRFNDGDATNPQSGYPNEMHKTVTRPTGMGYSGDCSSHDIASVRCF